MPNIVELLVGDGINIETSPTDGTMKLVNSSALSDQQRAALNNDKANENNKYLTSSEVDEKINKMLGKNNDPVAPGPNTAPPGFPKLITSSGNFVIPQNGRYRIKFCGGGGGGAAGSGFDADAKSDNPTFQSNWEKYRITYGQNGNPTSIEINGEMYTVSGGNGATFVYLRDHYLGGIGGKTYLKYNGDNGAVSGGDAAFELDYARPEYLPYAAKNGENAAMPGGSRGKTIRNLTTTNNFAYCTGGGAGGVIAGNVKAGKGMNGAFIHPNSDTQSIYYYGAEGGNGYGAGGGGGGSFFHQVSGSGNNGCGAGGGSGYLETKIMLLAKDSIIKVKIGAGGKGGKKADNASPGSYIGNGGDGAQGAVLIEWVSGN